MPWRRRKNQQTPSEYPTGVCVKTESGYFYINGKFRHLIKNRRVLKTWAFPFIIEGTEAGLSKYPKGKPLGFRDGTLVRDISDSKLYFISGRKRRLVATPEALTNLGLKNSDAVWAAHSEINLHTEGEVLV